MIRPHAVQDIGCPRLPAVFLIWPVYLLLQYDVGLSVYVYSTFVMSLCPAIRFVLLPHH